MGRAGLTLSALMLGAVLQACVLGGRERARVPMTRPAVSEARADRVVGRGARTHPIVVRRTPLDYPAMAAGSGVEGTVVVAARVDEDGRVTATRIKTSIPMLDSAAVRSVRDWEFRPGMERGRPVACWTAVRVEFLLPIDSWPLQGTAPR